MLRPPKQGHFKASVHLNNGLWLNVKATTPAVPPLAPGQTVIFLAVSIFFVLLALAFMVGKITRPMQMLANASYRLGKGEHVDDLPEKGPEDMRETIRAFNLMNSRLQRFVSDRIHMLAALSHDLRTPITTMQLRVELMPESNDRNRLRATLDEMKQMSEATLAFIRQSSDNEQTQKVDLNAMMESLCDDQLHLGHDVRFAKAGKIVVECRLTSLKRAIRNLVENAVKYGNRAEVRMEVSGNNVFVIIQDYGPGIPEDQMNKVFEPFFRIESSRNRNTGGIGLGMAISRNMIRNHGGEIYLENNPQGLKVKVVLPLDLRK
ncbi:ATP-binding protein [Endozoicomonas sp. 2B-B]